jgi:hypothetical protein
VAKAESRASDRLAGVTADALAERYGIVPRTVREKLAKAGLAKPETRLTED